MYCLKCVEGFYRAGKECVPCEQSSPLIEVLGYPLIIAACIAFFALIPFFIRKAPRFERLSRMSEKAAKHGKRLAVEVMPLRLLAALLAVLVIEFAPHNVDTALPSAATCTARWR